MSSSFFQRIELGWNFAVLIVVQVPAKSVGCLKSQISQENLCIEAIDPPTKKQIGSLHDEMTIGHDEFQIGYGHVSNLLAFQCRIMPKFKERCFRNTVLLTQKLVCQPLFQVATGKWGCAECLWATQGDVLGTQVLGCQQTRHRTVRSTRPCKLRCEQTFNPVNTFSCLSGPLLHSCGTQKVSCTWQGLCEGRSRTSNPSCPFQICQFSTLSQDFKLPTETGTSTSGAPVLKKGLRLTTHACNHPGIWMKFGGSRSKFGLGETIQNRDCVVFWRLHDGTWC